MATCPVTVASYQIPLLEPATLKQRLVCERWDHAAGGPFPRDYLTIECGKEAPFEVQTVAPLRQSQPVITRYGANIPGLYAEQLLSRMPLCAEHAIAALLRWSPEREAGALAILGAIAEDQARGRW